jgi:hypothetical protein
MMTRSKDGREFQIFGVFLETQEGKTESIYGANLRIALRDAKVVVGDRVEIVKIGRRTVEEGKAPMNLFKVYKIA